VERKHDRSFDQPLGFAPDDDAPIPYMARTRDYYQAIGLRDAYRWAHYVDAPFHLLRKPLSLSRVAIVTTAPRSILPRATKPRREIQWRRQIHSVYDGDTSKPHDLRISHIAYDRIHSSADDSRTWFPLPQLRLLAPRADRRSRAALLRRADQPQPPRHHRDRRAEILARCRADAVDAAVLVPNCPVCHQTISLVARHLEEAAFHRGDGLRQGYRRARRGAALFVQRFSAGNSAGKPPIRTRRRSRWSSALRVLEAAPGAQTTVQSPLRWSADTSWKRDYNNIAQMSPDELVRRRREFDAQKEIARGIRESVA